MGALANAVLLRKDPDFASWVETAIAYTARNVIIEPTSTPNHNVRLQLARDAAVTPSMILPIMLTAVATDPAIATLGSTTTAIGEQNVLDKVAADWTVIAQLIYPNVVG